MFSAGSSAQSLRTIDSFWARSRPRVLPDETQASTDSHCHDSAAAALSDFLLETASRQLKQYHVSSLAEETKFINLGEGVDYSVDVTHSDEGSVVVVKHLKDTRARNPTIDRDPAPECAKIRKVLQEIRIASHPPLKQCPNILDVLGYGWEYSEGKTTTPCLVIEYAEQGTLRQYLTCGNPKTPQEKLALATNIGQGLQALHACSIIHGDVKLDNMLVITCPDNSKIAKVADFGSSIIQVSDNDTYTYFGTSIYNAPEIRQFEDSQSDAVMPADSLFACDIYSFGLLLLEIVLDGQCYVDSEIEALNEEAKYQEIFSVALNLLKRAVVEDPLVKARFEAACRSSVCAEQSHRAGINAVIGTLCDDKSSW